MLHEFPIREDDQAFNFRHSSQREREYTKVYLQSGLQISSILRNNNTDQKEYIGEQKTTSIRELRVGFYTGICDE